MHHQINFVPILVAALVNYAIATVWYAVLFGKRWQKLTGITSMKPAPITIILSLVGSFFVSYVLYHIVLFGNAYFQNRGVEGGLLGGFHSWLGFVAPVTLMTKLYEGKPWGLWLLDNGFWLVSLLVMGVILSLWM